MSHLLQFLVEAADVSIHTPRIREVEWSRKQDFHLRVSANCIERVVTDGVLFRPLVGGHAPLLVTLLTARDPEGVRDSSFHGTVVSGGIR